jgi:hypothetical protein
MSNYARSVRMNYPIPKRLNYPITQPKQNKYKNTKIEIDNIKFDSKREANRYLELKKLERIGKIICLKLQEPFMLQQGYEINGKKVKPIYYIADFIYIDPETAETIVEDVKGIRTEVYRLKKKLFEYKYQVGIKEV